MLLDYKVAVLVGPSGLSAHQRLHLRSTLKTIKESTNNSILMVPGLRVLDPIGLLDPFIKEQSKGPTQLVMKGFCHKSPIAAVVGWLLDQHCDQYLAYPGRQQKNIQKCRVWSAANELGKLGIHTTISLPWIKQGG